MCNECEVACHVRVDSQRERMLRGEVGAPSWALSAILCVHAVSSFLRRAKDTRSHTIRPASFLDYWRALVNTHSTSLPSPCPVLPWGASHLNVSHPPH